MAVLKWLFSFYGRIQRVRFFWGGWLIIIVILAIDVRLSMASLHGQAENLETSFYQMILPLPLIYWSLSSLLVKRLHDMNASGWWVLLFLCIYIGLAAAVGRLYFKYFPEGYALGYVFWVVVIIGTLMKLVCFGILVFVPGTKGENRYEV